MSTRMRIAFWCYLLGTLTRTAFGIAYLVSPEFMPYHSEAVAEPLHVVLDENLADLGADGHRTLDRFCHASGGRSMSTKTHTDSFGRSV